MNPSASPTSIPSLVPSSNAIPSSPNVKKESNWLGISIQIAKQTATIGECLPFPYVTGVASIAVSLLETIEKIGKNKSELEDLAKRVAGIIEVIRDGITTHGEASAQHFEEICLDLQSFLKALLAELQEMERAQTKRKKLIQYLTVNKVKDAIVKFKQRVDDVKEKFALQVMVDSRMSVSKLGSTIEGLHAQTSEDLHKLHSDTAFAHHEIFTRTTDVQTAVGVLQTTTSDIHFNIQDIKSILNMHNSSFKKAFHSLIPGDLELKRELRHYARITEVAELESFQVQVRKVKAQRLQLGQHRENTHIIDYIANVNNSNTAKLIRSYDDSASAEFEEDLEQYGKMRHPNISQLFGVCDSVVYRALVFHGISTTLAEYAYNLDAFDWMKYYDRAKKDFESAFAYLRSHDAIALLGPQTSVADDGRILLDNIQSCKQETIQSGNLIYLPWNPQARSGLDDSDDMDGSESRKQHARDRLRNYYDAMGPLPTMTQDRVEVMHRSKLPQFGSMTMYRRYSGIDLGLIASIPPSTLSLVYEIEVEQLGSCSCPPHRARLGTIRPMVHTCIPLPFSAFCNEGVVLRLRGIFTPHARKKLQHAWFAQAQHIFDRRHIGSEFEMRTLRETCQEYHYQVYRDFEPFRLSDTFMADTSPSPYPDYVYLIVTAPPAYDPWTPVIFWSFHPPLADGRIDLNIDDDFRLRMRRQASGFYDLWTSSREPLVSSAKETMRTLRSLHEACGFDPSSDDIARYLGLPLFNVPSGEYADAEDETCLCGAAKPCGKTISRRILSLNIRCQNPGTCAASELDLKDLMPQGQRFRTEEEHDLDSESDGPDDPDVIPDFSNTPDDPTGVLSDDNRVSETIATSIDSERQMSGLSDPSDDVNPSANGCLHLDWRGTTVILILILSVVIAVVLGRVSPPGKMYGGLTPAW